MGERATVSISEIGWPITVARVVQVAAASYGAFLNC